MSNFSILIIDDHPIYRDAICEKLTVDFLPHSIAVACLGTIDEAISHINRSNKDWVILLDLVLPGSNPVELIAKLKNLPRVTYIVAISGLNESEWKTKSINAGADIFISKNNTSHFIYKGICELLDINTEDTESAKSINLTNRQVEVLGYLATGHSNKAIADQLNISEQTVKIHINSIFKKLGVSNRTQAVYKSQMLKLI